MFKNCSKKPLNSPNHLLISIYSSNRSIKINFPDFPCPTHFGREKIFHKQEKKFMPQSYVSSLYHCVFSTKERQKLITPELQTRLYPYLGGTARENKMKLLTVGGIPDHVHLLLSFPKTMTIAKGLQLIKGGSSKWIHDNFARHQDFAWQKGYGAFSIGVSDIERTKVYIENQAEHHRERDFKEEFLMFLKRNEIDFDERYVFD
jgi:REP element-mobilizing transposase RayT